jgi:hypothetical protein
MKKRIVSVFLTVLVTGVLLFTTCGDLEDLLSDPMSNFGFSANELTAGDAGRGVRAGKFSAEGGSGTLSRMPA